MSGGATATPRPNELLAELKVMAWTCASLDAQVCAGFPPRLNIVTQHNQPQPKCLTKSVPPATAHRLRALPHLTVKTKSAASIEEVTDQPLLTLLSRPNPIHNSLELARGLSPCLFAGAPLGLRAEMSRVAPTPAVDVTEACFFRTLPQAFAPS